MKMFEMSTLSKNILFLMLVFVMTGLSTSMVFATQTYYVAPDGNDNNTGDINSPLKTPTGARNKIRTLSKPLTEWVYVNFREGRYTTLGLGSDDGSESLTYGIRYQAYSQSGDYASEKVIFDGGVDLDVSSAYIVTDSNWLARFKTSARGKIYCIDSVPSSVSDNLSGQNAVVTMDDKLMISPRWPVLGYVKASGNPSGSTTIPLSETVPSLVVSEFARTGDMYIAAYLSSDWYKEKEAVTGLDSSHVSFSGTGDYGTDSGARVQIINVLAELDEEGEFYYDEGSGKFFFRPYDDVINEDSYISVANATNVISVSDCINVGFKNIIIQNGATCGIKFIRGQRNFIAACTIRNCRYWGACVGDPYSNDPSYAGTEITIGHSDIYDCGQGIFTGGVRMLGGDANESAITAAGNVLKNCHIWNIRNIDSGDRGISINGVGNTVEKNLIHNILGNCVWGGNDQTIQYNEMFGIDLEKGDGGPLYTANTFWTYGNNIRYNFIHHILTKPGMHGLMGLYFDQKEAGDTSTGNVFYKTGDRAIAWNGGAGQKANGNLFVACNYGTFNQEYNAQDAYDSNSIGLATVAVVGTNGWNNSPWTKYSLFRTIMNQKVNRNWPIECTVSNNVFVGMLASDYPQGYFTNASHSKVSYASENGDTVTWSNNQNQSSSILKNLDVLDFTYQNFTPTVQIDFASIGIYKNTYRFNVPNKDTYRRFIKLMLSSKQGYTTGSYNRTTANGYIYYNFNSPMWEVYDGMPKKYLGLTLWLDGADRTTTLNSDWGQASQNSTFEYWIDKSGCGNHFFQLASGYRPQINADQNGINGISTPDFQGADEHMVSDMTLSNTGTLFVVVRHHVNAYDMIFNTDANAQVQLRDSGNGTTGIKYNAEYSSFTPRPAAGSVVVYSVTFEPNSQNWYYNGTLKLTGTTAGFTSNSQKVILGATNSTGNSAFDGEIAEVILYDRYLSDSARQEIESYLASKWQ
jgi:hypothetical protein